ncbi:helix-turn-helix domain-containing protein [Actinomyces oris]|uniref:Helix-turn-helix domain-containing protein n=1 Tax=Actinomyces oris TaxID=544580 RepID=A0A508BPE5_9ACTO|nr:helix-turn-helix domain-containing protein [Actinomyces oris]QQC39318.1 helix-turn-helix domain-containing protein [Actinomyces oris]TQD63143.1 helix-turn-helix domain-containing protein [Actinomyces oris]
MTTTPALAALPMGPAAVAASGRRSSGRNLAIAASKWEWLDAVEAPTSPLEPSARHVACVLARRAGDVRDAWAPQQRLAEATGMSRRNVRRAMGRLEATGFLALTAKASQHRAPRYTLTIPPVIGASADDVQVLTASGETIPIGASTDRPEDTTTASPTTTSPVDNHAREDTMSSLNPAALVDNPTQGGHHVPSECSREDKSALQGGHHVLRSDQDQTIPLPPTPLNQPERGHELDDGGREESTSTAAGSAGAASAGDPGESRDAVDVVRRHRCAIGLRVDVAMLVAPLTARGWRARDIQLLLSDLPPDAGPGLLVRALRAAVATPPPSRNRSPDRYCPTHDRPLTRSGVCPACRADEIAAVATPPRRAPARALARA